MMTLTTTKKIFASLMALMLLASLLCAAGAGASGHDTTDSKMPMEQQKVELTAKQIKKLEKIHRKILKEKKRLISIYVDYGMMTPEKGDMIIKHLEKRYEHLKERGFMPDYGKKKCDQCEQRELEEKGTMAS